MPEVGQKRETERFDLETAPPDGFVELRKLTYGEDLKVRGMSMRMHMQQEELRRARREAKKEGRDDADIEVEMSIDVDAVTFFQFSRTIVAHNLTINGRAINFKSRQDFEALDPEVGAEIEKCINKMNPNEAASKEDEAADREAAKNGQGDGPLSIASGKP